MIINRLSVHVQERQAGILRRMIDAFPRTYRQAGQRSGDLARLIGRRAGPGHMSEAS